MYIGGLDIGTTGCKIAVYDENAKLRNTVYTEYDVKRVSGLHEIDLGEVWNSVKKLLVEVCKDYPLDAIGVTSFGETFAMLDEDDNIIAPSMLYTDPRGSEECQELMAALGEENIAFKTGVKPHSMFSLPKVMWIKKNMPEAYAKAKRVLLVQDFIVYKLSGVAQIDTALAARTLAFNVEEKAFDKDIIAAAGVEYSLFSKPVLAGTLAGPIKACVAEELGVPATMQIVTACHDQIAAMIGAGVLDNDVAMDGTGTVECVPVVMDSIPKSFDIYKYGYSVVPHVNGKYACYVLSYAGGATLKWFRDTIAQYEKEQSEKDGTNVYAILDRSVKTEAPSGLMILPHFAGAATPYMNASAKASIVGLTFENDRADLYKALMEGTAYEIKLNLDVLEEFGAAPTKLRATGGGASSDIWLQIKADIMNVEITALNCKEVGAAGTALMTGKAIGVYGDIAEYSAKMAPVRKTFVPNPAMVEKYAPIYKKYTKLYDALASIED